MIQSRLISKVALRHVDKTRNGQSCFCILIATMSLTKILEVRLVYSYDFPPLDYFWQFVLHSTRFLKCPALMNKHTISDVKKLFPYISDHFPWNNVVFSMKYLFGMLY